MGIENVTYKSLVDKIVLYIRTNCYNLNTTSPASKYDSLPNCFKSGYKKTYTAPDGTSTYTFHGYISLTGNAVTKVNDTVNTDLTAFLTSAGFTNLNTNITPDKFISFFNNVVSFCMQYLCFTTSVYVTESYLIYGNNGSTETYTGVSDDIVYAKSMNDVLDVLENRLSVLLRCIPVRYTCSFD